MEPTSPNSFGTTSYGGTGLGNRTVVPVGKGTRFGEFLIDAILAGVVSNIISRPLFSALSIGVESFSTYYALSTLISAAVQFCYYYFQEKGSGLTLGKRVLGTKVVMLDGSPVTDDAVLKRSLWRLIPLIDAVTFLISDRGLHDSQSDTTVVSSK